MFIFYFFENLTQKQTLICDPLTLQHKAVCSLRAAVSGHKHCEQIAVHMLLIELCRAPIAHCLQSQTEFPCLFFSCCHQPAQLFLSIQGKNTLRIQRTVLFQKSKQIIALITDTLRLDRRRKKVRWKLIFWCKSTRIILQEHTVFLAFTGSSLYFS